MSKRHTDNRLKYEKDQLKQRKDRMGECYKRPDGVIQCPTRQCAGYGLHSVIGNELVPT